jgi:hypothetical protein
MALSRQRSRPTAAVLRRGGALKPRTPDRPYFEALLDLQRLAGNRAVTQALSPAERPRPTVQRHSSWEHRLLGDVDPATLQVITRANEFEGRPYFIKEVLTRNGRGLGKEKGDAVHAIQEQLDNLEQWQSSPPAKGQTTWKGVQLVTVNLNDGGEVVCSVGEMNTLADYYGSVEHLKQTKATTLSMILQTVRRQGWEKLHNVLTNIDPAVAAGRKEPVFGGSLEPGADFELDLRTHDSRNQQSQTYLANAARNACHFAPQSWYRWKEFHERARMTARVAWAAKQLGDSKDNESLKKIGRDLANEAIMTNGFGDHYLQDSFAAGHLINKTLVMQWFVEWMGSRDWKDYAFFGGSTAGRRYIRDWSRVSEMTAEEQPGLAGVDLYKRPKGAVATDPQSAEEQKTREDRIARLRLQGADKEEAYEDYLAMLNSAAVQLAAKELHDHFCEKGLTVFANDVRVGLIYGDGDMISGGEGVQWSAQTARKSQEAITALLTGKDPELDSDAIMARLPNQVMLPKEGYKVSLEEWHTGGKLKEFCEDEMFPDVHYRIAGRFSTTPFSYVSRDEPGGMDLATEESVEWAKSAKHKAESVGSAAKTVWEPVHLPW